jgi:hypothetical protein
LAAFIAGVGGPVLHDQSADAHLLRYVSRAADPWPISWMEPGQPGRTMSEKSTLQVTVELTVEGVPAGTLKAAVLIETEVERQRSPAVVSD